MLLRTPAAVTPEKWRVCDGTGVFYARGITGTELSPAEGWSPRHLPAQRAPVDNERCSRYSEQCSSELNSVHLSGVLPGRRAQSPARRKGEPMTTTTPMTSWDLFEDLRAAQDEMMR